MAIGEEEDIDIGDIDTAIMAVTVIDPIVTTVLLTITIIIMALTIITTTGDTTGLVVGYSSKLEDSSLKVNSFPSPILT